MVDRIDDMDSRTISRMAASVALVLAASGTAASLVACGQKGPLYLPEGASESARARLPGAPDDEMPSTRPALPPAPSPSTPGLPSPSTGVPSPVPVPSASR
jgi:predicted small lipoprotein YifL